MNPALVFLLLFVGVPLGELYLLIQVGDDIGAFSTIVLVVLTAVIGGAIARIQGIGVLLRARELMARDETPAIEVLEGAVLLCAGLLLLLPGFVTDALGFLCLIPPLRKRLILGILSRSRVIRPGDARDRGPGPPPPLEGEWRRDD